jgi:hypothetical protein
MGLADDCTAEIFEAMFLAYVRGLMRPADRERNDREGTR